MFSLGLAASAFLLFSAYTGIEGPAEAEQAIQGAAKSVENTVENTVKVSITTPWVDSPMYCLATSNHTSPLTRALNDHQDSEDMMGKSPSMLCTFSNRPLD